MRQLPLVDNGVTYQKEWWNDVSLELQNIVKNTTDMELDAANNYQLSEVVSRYAAIADFYTDTGTSNNYILSLPFSKIPIEYVDGMKIKFKALNSNTGDSFVNINNIGKIQIKKENGMRALEINDIIQNNFCELIYNANNNCFDLLPIISYIRGSTILQTSFLTKYTLFAFNGSSESKINDFDCLITPKSNNSLIEYELTSCLFAADGGDYNGFPSTVSNSMVALNVKVNTAILANNYSAERALITNTGNTVSNHSLPFIIKGLYNNNDLIDKTFSLYATGSPLSTMYPCYIGSTRLNIYYCAISNIKITEYAV